MARTSAREDARILLAHKTRLLRFLRGWNQSALAHAAGLHRTYISAIERGNCNISLDNIQKLASGFGVSVAELFTRGPSDDER